MKKKLPNRTITTWELAHDSVMDQEMKKNSFFHGSVTLICLSILDIVTTAAALSMGATELNPISDWLIHHGFIFPSEMLGLVGPLKFAILALIVWRLFSDRKIRQREVSGLWWVTGVYSLAIVLNFYHIFLLL